MRQRVQVQENSFQIKQNNNVVHVYSSLFTFTIFSTGLQLTVHIDWRCVCHECVYEGVYIQHAYTTHASRLRVVDTSL